MSNPIYLHQPYQLLDSDRDKRRLFDYVGADPEDECSFFLNPFEAYFNLYYSVYIDIIRQSGRNHILTTPLEPFTFFHVLKKIEILGVVSKQVVLNSNGQVSPESLAESVGPRTAFLSLSWANALTGVIHPIEEIAAFCKERAILLHVDATSIFGRHYFRFKEVPVDFLTISFKGMTLLFKKKQAPLHFLQALDNPYNLMANEACLILERLDHFCTETVRLLNKLERGILSHIPDSLIHFQKVERLPYCMAVAIPGVAGPALEFFLSRKGVYVTCGGKEHPKLSQTLIQSGVDPELSHASFSVALAYDTQENHIDRAIEMIVLAVKKLRNYATKI